MYWSTEFQYIQKRLSQGIKTNLIGGGEMTTATAKKKKTAFADVLAATTEDPKKVKNGKPIVDPKADVKEAVDAFIEAKKAKKIAEAEMSANGATIIEHVREIQDKDGFAGKFSKSYDVLGSDGKVLYTATNRYSISEDDEEEIAEILGDNVDRLVDEEHEVKLRSEVLKDEALQEELLSLIGAENFTKFFTTKRKLTVAEDFDRAVYDHTTKDELEALRTFIKGAKPSLR
jgi:hypothetical protein